MNNPPSLLRLLPTSLKLRRTGWRDRSTFIRASRLGPSILRASGQVLSKDRLAKAFTLELVERSGQATSTIKLSKAFTTELCRSIRPTRRLTNFLCISLLLLNATALGMNPSFASSLASGGQVNLDEQLIEASKNGNLEAVERLIAQGASVEVKDNHGFTSLILAATNGHEAVCRLLIENKALVEAKDNDGWNPLTWAATKGHEAVCRLLIENKASIEAKDNDRCTPLMWAAHHGYKDVCKLLIMNRALVEAKNNYGETPLIYAAFNGHEDVCRLLIEHGASVEAKSNTETTPLMRASQNGHDAICRLLIQNRASVEAKDKNGATPLIFAIRQGHESVCRLLIANKASVKLETNYGETPLMWAAECEHEGICKLLLNVQLEPVRKNITAIDTFLGIVRKRPQDLPCHMHYDIAKIIARQAFQLARWPVIEQINKIDNNEKQAKWLAYLNQQMNSPIINARNTDDIKPKKPRLLENGMNNLDERLADAARRGDLEDAKELIARGAAIEAKSPSGWTPLSRAARNGHEDVCKLLIANKASVAAKDNDGKTPLIWAAENDHEGVYKLLIENKAAIEVQDKRGLTPLSWAAGKGHGNLCKLLIANKASVEAKDNNRETPLALAAANGRDAVCELLIDTQLEPIKKGKAAIVTLLAIAKKRRAKLSCHMPYDVAKIIARHAFAMIQQSKRPIIEQINCIASKEERTKWLQYAKHQMNTPVVYAQDIHGNQAHNAIPAEDIKPKESRLVEKCTLQ